MKTVELPDDVFEVLESYRRSRGLSLAEAVLEAMGTAGPAAEADKSSEPEPDDETRDWMEADLSRLGEHEPYDWNGTQAPRGRPVHYQPGVGFVVVGGKGKRDR